MSEGRPKVTMRIRILGAHHNEMRNAKMVSLLIDDKLAVDAGGLTSSLSWDEQLALQAILLTHQHYDHVRDVPCAVVPFFRTHRNIVVYAIQSVCETLTTHLLNGEFYPNFLALPAGSPALTLSVVQPDTALTVLGYRVLPVQMNHPVPTVGYQITSPEGNTLFFGGDSGPGLQNCWQKVSPHLAILDVTYDNSQGERARQAGHLTPNTLKEELIGFRQLKGYLPQIVVIHMDPDVENKITAEIRDIAKELSITINIAYEGMEISL